MKLVVLKKQEEKMLKGKLASLKKTDKVISETPVLFGMGLSTLSRHHGDNIPLVLFDVSNDCDPSFVDTLQ